MVTDTDLSWVQVADECRPTFKTLRSHHPTASRLLDPFLWKIVNTVEEPMEIPTNARAVIFPHLFSHSMILLEESWKVPTSVDAFGEPSSGGNFDGIPSGIPSDFRLPAHYGPPAADTRFDLSKWSGGGQTTNLSRRAPAYPVYDPTNNKLQRIFSKFLERDILSQPNAMAAQRFVRALMGGNDNGILENANFVNATSQREVLGALLCEVEGVDTPFF